MSSLTGWSSSGASVHGALGSNVSMAQAWCGSTHTCKLSAQEERQSLRSSRSSSVTQLVWDQPEAHKNLSEKNRSVLSPMMSLWGLLEDPRAFSHLWGLRTYRWSVVSHSAIKKKSNNGYFRIRNPMCWGWWNGSGSRRTCCCWLWWPEFKPRDTHSGKSKLPQAV